MNEELITTDQYVNIREVQTSNQAESIISSTSIIPESFGPYIADTVNSTANKAKDEDRFCPTSSLSNRIEKGVRVQTDVPPLNFLHDALCSCLWKLNNRFPRLILSTEIHYVNNVPKHIYLVYHLQNRIEDKEKWLIPQIEDRDILLEEICKYLTKFILEEASKGAKLFTRGPRSNVRRDLILQ